MFPSSMKRRSGAAIKMEEDVPTIIPKSIIQANPDKDVPPNKARGKAAKKTVREVASVRLKVSLIERSISS